MSNSGSTTASIHCNNVGSTASSATIAQQPANFRIGNLGLGDSVDDETDISVVVSAHG
jgi:hypothetical protein